MPLNKLFALVLCQEVMQMKHGLARILFKVTARCLMLVMVTVLKYGNKRSLWEVYMVLRLVGVLVSQCLATKPMFQNGFLYINAHWTRKSATMDRLPTRKQSLN